MAQTQRGFNDPAYQARQVANFGAIAAGSGGVTSKFVAFAALQLMSLITYQTVLGTSTYTNTVTGAGTATASGQQLSVIAIYNTNTLTNTTTVALTTTTIGPFLAGGNGTAGQVGGTNQFALNTATSAGLGVANQGGVPIPQGAQFYVVSGTDATAVNLCAIDFQISQQAPLTL